MKKYEANTKKRGLIRLYRERDLGIFSLPVDGGGERSKNSRFNQLKRVSSSKSMMISPKLEPRGEHIGTPIFSGKT
mgnify:CR=1 FL=1